MSESALPATIEDWLESRRDELFALLPSNIQKERFLRNIIMQIKMNDGLKRCSIQSIAKACVQASTLGLDIGVLGSAYLVPYGNDAQLSVGYQGYIDLAYRSGMKSIHTGIVRQNDEYKATQDDFTHEFDPFSSEEFRGPVVGVYCLVCLPTGSTYSELMTATEVDQIRSGSRSANSPAWRDHWGEMAKKVVIRRALKRAPLSVEVKEVIQSSDNAEYAYGKTPPPPATFKKKLADSRPKALPQPRVGEPIEGASVWDDHKEKANELAKVIGVSKWNKINRTRQAMLTQRIKEEGFQIRQVEEFWAQTIAGFTPFKKSIIESWDSADLDVFLRIPKRGNPDHYQAAMEGKYRDGEQVAEDTFSVTDMITEGE
jgi:recombination protein RecT